MTTIQITQNLPRLCGLLFSMVIIGVSLEAKADEIFKMQTHPKEVPGTWEIIHSQYDRALTALEIAAARTKRSGRDDAPILTNLCVVHMKLGNDEMATDYCERAVDARSQFGIAYNNRGVLRALKQNFASAAEDSAVARKRRESVDAATFTWSALASRCRNTMVIRR